MAGNPTFTFENSNISADDTNVFISCNSASCDGTDETNTSVGIDWDAVVATVNAADDFGMEVDIYQDEAWNNWQDAVYDLGRSNISDEQEQYLIRYDENTLRIKCNMTSMGANLSSSSKANCGCCLRDEDDVGGGYCVMVNADEDGVDTYFVSDEQFAAVLLTPYTFDDIDLPEDIYEGITKF